MNVETMGDLFGYELQGLYYVETELAEELGQLSDQSNVDTLDELPDAEFRDSVQQVFAGHREDSREHAGRLEDAFDEIFGREPEPREVPALDGLLTEKERFNNIVLNDSLRLPFYLDVGIKAEQLEIRCYDSLLQLAEFLDISDGVVEGLETNRDEDRAMLRALEELATGEGARKVFTELADDTPQV